MPEREGSGAQKGGPPPRLRRFSRLLYGSEGEGGGGERKRVVAPKRESETREAETSTVSRAESTSCVFFLLCSWLCFSRAFGMLFDLDECMIFS